MKKDTILGGTCPHCRFENQFDDPICPACGENILSKVRNPAAIYDRVFTLLDTISGISEILTEYAKRENWDASGYCWQMRSRGWDLAREELKSLKEAEEGAEKKQQAALAAMGDV